MDAVVKVPTGISHDANIELVKEALQTPRLHEQINGPWKLKGKNDGDQFNGVLVVRVKSKQQYEHMKTALREIEEDIGKTCIFPDPDWSKLPAFKPMKISIVPVNNGEHVRADGATYNLRSFLGLIGFEWRRADNFARKFVTPRPGPAPTRQPRTPGGAAAGGAARRRAPRAYKRTAFLLWKLGCSSWGAKRRSCAYKHRHSEPSESLGLSEAAPRSIISTSAPDTPHPKGRRRQHWRNARPGEIERTALEPREHK